MTKRKATSRKSSAELCRKQSLYERISKSLDIPPDLSPSCTTISIRGRASLSVCGKTAISLYTPEEIRLRLPDGELSIRGESLVCISYHVREVGVEGRITSVSFEDDDGRGC